MTPHAVARRLSALGFSVIPVPVPHPGVPEGQPGDGKVPILAWRDYQSRRPTLDEIDTWFGHGPMNVAVVTGTISGVVVIDADSPDALRWCTSHLTYTPWQVQTARGFHLYYRHPDVLVRNRAGLATRDGRLHIDVRGDGGFVIAPPSQHASGVLYRFGGDWTAPREAVPRFWSGWLQPEHPPTPPRRPRPSTTGSELVVRARAYLAAIPRPEIGAGSDTATFNAACRVLRGFNLSTAEAEELLWEWAGGRPGWTREWVAAKVAHADRYGREQIGGLL